MPPPDVNAVRVRLIYSGNVVDNIGNRFYLSFGGSRPSGSDLTTFAGAVAGEWNTHLAPLCATFNALTEVDVLDITDDMGAFGTWTGSHDGTRSGTAPPVQVALDVEYNISRRYRGGKPRIYFPFGVEGDFADPAHWASGLLTAAASDVPAFFTAVAGDGWSGAGTIKHINLSYYKGFHNITNSSGRERAVPTYRTTALHDDVTGYAIKAMMGSQKRRRSSTSP